MLETVRQYALEQLTASGEAERHSAAATPRGASTSPRSPSRSSTDPPGATGSRSSNASTTTSAPRCAGASIDWRSRSWPRDWAAHCGGSGRCAAIRVRGGCGWPRCARWALVPLILAPRQKCSPARAGSRTTRRTTPRRARSTRRAWRCGARWAMRAAWRGRSGTSATCAPARRLSRGTGTVRREPGQRCARFDDAQGIAEMLDKLGLTVRCPATTPLPRRCTKKRWASAAAWATRAAKR